MSDTSAEKGRIDLSIIIVNHNTKRLLQQCLESVLETSSHLSSEIFVVDNASTDGSVEMVSIEFPQIHLIANPEGLGFARAANSALASAVGDYLLICHPDIKFMPGAVQEMYTFLQGHPKTGIVGANLLYPDGSYCPCANKRHSIRQDLGDFLYSTFQGGIKKSAWLKGQFEQEKSRYYWNHQVISESDLIWNACMMFRREVLETVGNFYEGFFIWFADTDWCYRAQDMGWQMYYLAEAYVVHYERQSANYIDNDMVRYKVKSTLVQKAVNKDRYTLLERHYSSLYLWLKKTLDVSAAGILYGKLAILRIFAPARYRYLIQ